jgi:hypothetical protein
MSRTWRQATKPRITPDDLRFTEFAGLVNTRSRKDIGLKALYVADNVVISDSKKITRRDGYSLYRNSTTVRSAYGCGDSLYVVEGGTLLRMASASQDHVLTTGLTGTRFNWDEINGDAYYVSETDAGTARGDQHLPWRLAVPAVMAAQVVSSPTLAATAFNLGATYTEATFRFCATYETSDGRETAPSEMGSLTAPPQTDLIRVTVTPTPYARTNIYATEPDGTVLRLVATTTGTTVTFNPLRGGRELTTLDLYSMPDGVTHIAFCLGRCYAAQYMPSAKQTIVFFSQPLGFHLWSPDDYIAVPGELALMLRIGGKPEKLLLGTTERVYVYDAENGLGELADYGVVPGMAGDKDAHGTAFFWTERGVCKALPFENLTEAVVSMPPGQRVTATMVYQNGMQQFIAATQGSSTAFNQRRERT